MAHWCDSCGQMLPEDSTPSNAVWLEAPEDGHQHTFTRPAGAKKSGIEKKLIGAIIAVIAVWGAFVGLGRVVTPDNTIDQEAAADIEQARVDREVERALRDAEAEREAEQEDRDIAAAQAVEPEAVEIAEVAGDYGAADAAPGFPDASLQDGGNQVTQVVQIVRPGDDLKMQAPSSPSLQAERLGRQLIRRGTPLYAAYESAVGVVLIDLLTTQAWILEPPRDVMTVTPGAPILRSGGASYAFDRSTLQVALVAEQSSLIVSDNLDGATYFADAKTLSGQASIIEVINDGDYGFHRLPPGGMQLRALDGLGLIASPNEPTGETLIAGTEGFDVLSQNRVLAGNSRALLEQVCEGDAACSLVVTNLAEATQEPVPAFFARFGDRYELSPDGQVLLRYTQAGFAEVLFVGTDSIAWVVNSGMTAPVWGPNSDFVAWLDNIGEPKLKVMFTDERDWLAVDLWALGVPPPLAPGLTIFAAPTPSAEAHDEG